MITDSVTPSEAAAVAATSEGTSSTVLIEQTIAEIEPDLGEARFFLDQLGPGEAFTFQTFSDRKPEGRDPLAKTFHGLLDEHANSLIDMNRRGAGVFQMVNEGDGLTHGRAKTCRTKANVLRVRAMFVDLDGSPLDPVRESDPRPSIIVESSPGKYHGYWLVTDCALDEFTHRQKEFAANFGGDASVSDLPRVLRLPGFFHQKNEPFMSRVIFPERHTQ